VYNNQIYIMNCYRGVFKKKREKGNNHEMFRKPLITLGTDEELKLLYIPFDQFGKGQTIPCLYYKNRGFVANKLVVHFHGIGKNLHTG
jgi:hypothetical protein